MAELKESTDFLPHQTYPWLAITEDGGEPTTTTTFYSLSQEKLFPPKRRIVPPGHRTLTSSRGWLLLMDTKSSLCHLSNLHSGAAIQLPAEPFALRRICSLLYFSDDDGGPPARVIHVHPDGLWFCDPGGDRFVKTDLVPLACDKLIGAAIRRGELYLAAEVMPEAGGFNSRLLVRFDFDSVAISEVTRFDSVEHSIRYGYKFQFFESAGDLFLVYRMYCHNEPIQQLCTFIIKQYKFETDRVIELGDLAGRTLFLGQTAGMYNINDSVLCGPVAAGIDPNSIHFLEANDKFLRVYSLEDDSLLMTLPNPEVKTSSSVSLDWIML